MPPSWRGKKRFPFSKPTWPEMNLPIKRTVLTAIAVTTLCLSLSAQAQQTPKPEQIIKWRQSVFQVIAWNSGRVKANVDGTYNKEEVVKASNSIAALANSGLGALFVAGTETGKGWHETSTKPALFAADSKVGEYAASFAKEAAELAHLAATSDQARVKEQFGKLGRTCKACHDDYKSKD
jgi:cytochrome c556